MSAPVAQKDLLLAEKTMSPALQTMLSFRDVFFPSFVCASTSTSDLGLASYLVYRGCTLERVVCVGRLGSFTIKGRGLHRKVNDYFQRKPMKISPLVFLGIRDRLKQFIVATPYNDSTTFPKRT